MKSRQKGQHHQSQAWAGVWSLKETPLTIGGILTFVEELLLVQQEHSLNHHLDILFCGHLDLPVVKQAISEGQSFLELSAQDCAALPAVEMVFDLEPIQSVWWVDDPETSIPQRKYEFVWPDLKSRSKISYDSTLNVQAYFAQHYQIPILQCQSQARKRAWEWYRKCIPGHMPVVVHLKNNPERPLESNANLLAWGEFFKKANEARDVRFVLIGNEDPGPSIREIDQVVVTQDYGLDLGRDLALMEMAYLFLGMASGPCNFAIYNDIPYVIFKNPEHHHLEMQQELNHQDRFHFGKPFQKIFRVHETAHGLLRGWESLVPFLTPEDWQKRIKRFHYQRT